MDSTTLGLFIGAVVLLLLSSLFFTFGELVAKRIQALKCWSAADDQLRRRYRLVPRLVDAVRPYAAHERATFERVVQAQRGAIEAQGAAAMGQAERELTDALGILVAIAERYPELRAHPDFRSLLDERSRVEAEIASALHHYQALATDYNAALLRTPSNIVAGWFNFKPAETPDWDMQNHQMSQPAPTARVET